MKAISLPLVNWGMGTILIGVFALVCIGLVLVIYNMSRSTEVAPSDEVNEQDDVDTENPML
ncbi:hypothetical protein [Nonlabens antarcticus]|uniref:hypothetical protein n=1 Tax=Nonlabens antarcticus TaxID=392714 RepID=UPI00189100DB|nr:hypothetical protein [Nonlabens antarcticus]